MPNFEFPAFKPLQSHSHTPAFNLMCLIGETGFIMPTLVSPMGDILDGDSTIKAMGTLKAADPQRWEQLKSDYESAKIVLPVYSITNQNALNQFKVGLVKLMSPAITTAVVTLMAYGKYSYRRGRPIGNHPCLLKAMMMLTRCDAYTVRQFLPVSES